MRSGWYRWWLCCFAEGPWQAEKGADRNLRSSAKGCTKSSPWGGITPSTRTCWKKALQKKPWGSWWIPGSPRARNEPSQQRKPTASQAELGVVSLSEGEDPSLLLSPGETHLVCWVQFWTYQYRRDLDILGWVERKTTKVIRALKHLTHEESCDCSSPSLEILRTQLGTAQSNLL